MRLWRIACGTFTLALAGSASAQTPQAYPPGVTARAVELNNRCQAAGGRTAASDRPFVHQLDLTGDGRAEHILDEAGFACSNRQITSVTPDGAPLEVFDGVTGQSLWRGLAFTYALQQGAARGTLVVTFRGRICSPNALASTTCQRALAWNASTRAFTGAPSMPAVSAPAQASAPALSRDPLAATAPSATVAAPAPAPKGGTATTVSEADKQAVFRTAGFKQVRGRWIRCEEETPTASYTPGEIEEVLDLNGDGRPEAVVTESSLFCYGQQGSWFGVLTKGANGAWAQILESDGVFAPLNTRTNGWRDIRVGGPGAGGPVLRFNGKEYARR